MEHLITVGKCKVLQKEYSNMLQNICALQNEQSRMRKKRSRNFTPEKKFNGIAYNF